MPTTLQALVVAAACSLAASAGAAEGLDDLFDLDAPHDAPAEQSSGGSGSGIRWSGYGEFAGAYTYRDPEHWSKLRTRFELAASGRAGAGIRYKISARADVDAAYHLEDHYYPGPVRRDQRRELSLREAYLDFSSGDFEFRVGRQHVVWGEMVGLFLADVVSARDMREVILPEFESMRIPQWAARAEYFAGQSHFEFLWIPAPSYDEVGKPGADFYPYPFIDGGTRVRTNRPSNSLSNSNWGLRASHLINGWDLSAFYYRSYDVQPTLYQLPGGSLELRNDRIHQLGGTFSKDYGRFVLKGETVHTRGRKYLTLDDPVNPLGLKSSETLDYAVGVDVPVGSVWRFNVQYFGRRAFQHDDTMGFDRDETGMTFLVNRKFGDRVEAEVLYIGSFTSSDYLVRPKLSWHMTQDWRAQVGADIFGGRDNGLFGRYDNQDRVYLEFRRWF